ncbi:MAG: hypothetical protein KDA93_15000 [Planctomycetaceae bacterium]|nr:hypothetical protein [Planctomycetaceae bacterium]
MTEKSADDSIKENLFVVSGTDGILTVERSDDANGYANADAVRIERTQAPVTQTLPMVTIVDDGDTGFVLKNGA